MKSILACAALFYGIGFPQALSAAEKLVETPWGLRPASSVLEVSSGQEISGAVDANYPSSALSPLAKPTDDNGWVTYTYLTIAAGSQLERFATSWQVPPAPALENNQLLYLFNGLEDSGSLTILQPVLQWGVSPAGGGAYWAIASWYVTPSHAYHTPLVRVEPGEVLTGIMRLTGVSASGFSYESEFANFPQTQLSIKDASERTFVSETLESYRVSDCAQYPLGRTVFSAIAIEATPASAEIPWQQIDSTSQCGQSATVTDFSAAAGAVDLEYGDSAQD